MLIQSTLRTRPAFVAPSSSSQLPNESSVVGVETAEQVDSVERAQAERISRFVEEKKVQGARALRQVSGLMAGQLTGMAVGSMIFAPLAFHFGNLYIATGGAALTGAALAIAGSKLAEKDVSKFTDGTAGNVYGAVGAIANSLPKFVYPTLGGANAAEKAMIYEALDRLPLSGVTSAPTIDVVTGLQKAGASGLATPLFSHSRIFLDHNEIAYSKAWGQEVTTHEIGHTYDFTKGVGPIMTRNFWGGGFGKEPFVSDYAHTNRMEDYAESYATYHLDPKQLQAAAPAKYAAVHASQQPGLIDQALDRPAVREAGREIGSAFEAAPRLRNVLALGAGLVAPFQLFRGAAAYESGLDQDDPLKRINGKLSMASGAALLGPGTAPLSALLAAGQFVTHRQLESGAITVEQAEKRANAALAVSTGPFGIVAASVESELDKAGLLIKEGGPRLQSSNPFAPKRSLGKIGAGFALGAATGGLIAPFMHATSAHSAVLSSATGAWAGGLVGAALGLGAHLLTGPELPDFLAAAQEEKKLTGADKALLLKLGTPTVLGGAAGAVGGFIGGKMVGQVVGETLAGPAGGVTGAALGSYLGVLGGSYALSKGGALLGANWAGLKKPEGGA